MEVIRLDMNRLEEVCWIAIVWNPTFVRQAVEVRLRGPLTLPEHGMRHCDWALQGTGGKKAFWRRLN